MFDNLPDWIYKGFWTLVQAALGYLTTIAIPDVGPMWTPVLAAAWVPATTALRKWAAERAATPAEPG